MEEKVTIYSTPTCHFCHLAKDYLDEHKVGYVDFDVSADETKFKEMLEMTGQGGVPVIRIGNDVMIGFQKARMSELLGLNGDAASQA